MRVVFLRVRSVRPAGLAVLLALGACSRGGFGQLTSRICASQKCSGHGQCAVNSANAPVCVCDPGYHNDGALTCAVDANGKSCSACPPSAVVLSSMLVFNVTPNSFSVAASYSGDTNGDAVVTLHYCDATETPSCDPLAGASVPMRRGSSTFWADVLALGSPNDPGDTLTLEVVAVDPDGVGGSPLLGSTALLNETPIYRSVGVDAAALASGSSANTLAIQSSYATFSSALPDNIGVGDVIQYDANGDGQDDDGLVFIQGRRSSSKFYVRVADGSAAPSLAGSTGVWHAYRAYTSLADAVAGNENGSIAATLRNFDTWSGGQDLPASGEVWNIACYDDGVDSTPVRIDSWTTGPNNYLRIFTPVAAAEVGVSQRHHGVWGTGYRRTAAISVVTGYFRLQGLAIRQSVSQPTPVDDVTRVFFVHGQGNGTGEVWISDCYGEITATDAGYDVYDFYSTGTLTARLWNDIGISASTTLANGSWDSSEAFFINDSNVTAYIDNCTGIATGGSGFRDDTGSSSSVHLRNCLGVSRGGGTAFFADSNTIASVANCASNDTTAGNWGGTGNRTNQSFAFANAATNDFRLAATDTAARDHGQDLSFNASHPFMDDIEGKARIDAWDIGADEYRP